MVSEEFYNEIINSDPPEDWNDEDEYTCPVCEGVLTDYESILVCEICGYVR